MSANPRHRAPRAPRRGRRVAATVVAALSVTSVATASTSATFTDSAQGTAFVSSVGEFSPCLTEVTSGFTFEPGSSQHSQLCSPNRRYLARFQTDGNFVLYDMSTNPGTAIWATWTFRSDLGGVGAHLVFQDDGNLVVYTAAWQALRHTSTSGIPVPARLRLQDDGNLGLIDANGTVRWMSWGTQYTDCRTPGAFTCNPTNAGGA